MERSGELKRLEEQEARGRGIESVKHPPPVASLRPTETARTYYVDPSFTLDRNILGPQGELLFSAGTRKNPLEVVSLSRYLLFFDARDPRQVGRARQLMASYQGRVKPILTVSGSYLEFMKSWRIPDLLRPARPAHAPPGHRPGAGPGLPGGTAATDR
jgi:conjugal transfer pilus assembly protein TraW